MYLESPLRSLVFLLILLIIRLHPRGRFARRGLLQAFVYGHCGLDLALFHIVFYGIRVRIDIFGIKSNSWSRRSRIRRNISIFFNFIQVLIDGVFGETSLSHATVLLEI